MTKKRDILRSRWCGLLMLALAAMGFDSCHRAQKVVVDDGNITPTDTIIDRPKPPRLRDGGEIIALYGVPPSRFKNIEKQNVNPQIK